MKQSEIYVERLKRCLVAVRISVIASIVAVGGLIMFVVVAGRIDLAENDINAYMLGVVIGASVAAACVIAALTVLIISKVTVLRLKKIDSEENKS